jgi:hypothetical protein
MRLNYANPSTQNKLKKKFVNEKESKIYSKSLEIKVMCIKLKHNFNKQNILLDNESIKIIDNIIENALSINNIINSK